MTFCVSSECHDALEIDRRSTTFQTSTSPLSKSPWNTSAVSGAAVLGRLPFAWLPREGSSRLPTAGGRGSSSVVLGRSRLNWEPQFSRLRLNLEKHGERVENTTWRVKGHLTLQCI